MVLRAGSLPSKADTPIRARPRPLLPAFSVPFLFLGALSAFPVAPVAAQGSDQTIWSATLTAQSIPSWVSNIGGGVGCHGIRNSAIVTSFCLRTLSPRQFTHDGTQYRVGPVAYMASSTTIYFELDNTLPAALGAKLHISGGGTALEFALSGGRRHWTWNAGSGVTGQTWSAGDEISLSITIPITDPPGLPVGLSVTPGATQLALSWTAPWGSPTSYQVHYTSSASVADDAAAGTAVATEWVSVSGTVTGTSETITGLTNNTAYRVRVRGVNAQGSGAWAFGSGTPKATTTGSTDASLSALVVRNHSTALTLDPTLSATTYAYSAGEVNARTSITVTPTVNQANATVKVNGTSVTSGSASGTIDVAYGPNTIRVEVTAQAGNTRNYTIAVTRALPAVSLAASTLRAGEGEGQFALLTDGSNDMSGTVTYAPAGAHPVTVADDFTSASSTFTMTAGDTALSHVTFPAVLDGVNEENETFTVTIEEGTGYTVGSPATATVTLFDADPPAAPGGFEVEAGTAQLTARWTKPVGPVTGYAVRWKETAAPDSPATGDGSDPSTGWVGILISSGAATSYEITGLTNGTSYDVRVRAGDGTVAGADRNGYGEWTVSASGTPDLATPGVPRSVSAVPADGKLVLSWRAPASWGLGTAAGFAVEWKLSSGGASAWATAAGGGSLAASATSYEFTGAQTGAGGSSHTVANGASYDLRIRARSLRQGASEHSAWVTEANKVPMVVSDPPGRPVGLGVTPGATQLALSWTAPSGSPTSYQVHYTSSQTVADDAAAGTAVATEWVSVSGTVTGTSETITGLTNNTAYRVRVRGVNAQGSGAWAFGSGTPKATTTGSTDASLSALVVRNHSTALTLDPTLSATTYAYSAGEVNARTSITVTPTVNQANATVKVNGTSVTSGSASGTIDVAYGPNTIRVEVTAQAGNTRNYTITVTRALPVVKWEVATHKDEEGFTAQLRLEPQSNDMVGTVTYAATGTHPASLTDDLGSGRSTGFTMSAGDAYPSIINIALTDDALNEYDETFTITIEAGTGYTVGSPATVTFTITDGDPPAAPGGLDLSAGNAQLMASWTQPDGPVTQYQLRWKESTAPDSLVTSGSDPAHGWIVGSAAAATTQTITSLDNGKAYNVQVRADDGQTATGNGWGPWSASQTETPVAKVFGFSPTTIVVAPGVAADFTVSLSQAAPTGGLALTVTQLLGDDVPTGACGSYTLAEADDVGTSPPTSVTVAAGADEAALSYPTADNGDDLVNARECFGLRLSTAVAGWTASTTAGVALVQIERSNGNIAFGTDGAGTAKLTRTVAENVAGDTVQVPVTVDWLPYESVTFAVEVLAGGTATETADFSIGTKSVTFGPSTATTQNLTVTIVDDTAVEEDETIELRLADGPGGAGTNARYTRHAQGRLAALTIDSEDAVPGAVRDLSAAPDSAELGLTWRPPSSVGSSAVTGYAVHYTSAADTGGSAVADDAAASGTDASAAWVVSAAAVTDTTHTIGSLVNDRAYRVRVRAANAVGAGEWAHAKGTPAAGPKYGFQFNDISGEPGTSVRVSVVLSEAAPQGGLALTLTRLLGTNVPSGVCAGVTLADAADIGSNPPTSVTVAAGATTAQVRYPLADNGDDLVGGSECFALRLSTTAAGWNPGQAVLPVTIAINTARIAFGNSAGSTAKYAAAVAENVTGGTVDVPVTVDRLPTSSTTVSVEVLGAGAATEGSDFTIATKSVTFGPSTATTQNLTVTFTAI